MDKTLCYRIPNFFSLPHIPLRSELTLKLLKYLAVSRTYYSV